jgi:hypothetical protein
MTWRERRVSLYEEAPGLRLGPRGDVASTIHESLACGFCGERSAAKLKQCSKCRRAHFCNKECMLAGWPAGRSRAAPLSQGVSRVSAFIHAEASASIICLLLSHNSTWAVFARGPGQKPGASFYTRKRVSLNLGSVCFCFRS